MLQAFDAAGRAADNRPDGKSAISPHDVAASTSTSTPMSFCEKLYELHSHMYGNY